MDRSETGSFVQIEEDIAIWHDKHSKLSNIWEGKNTDFTSVLRGKSVHLCLYMIGKASTPVSYIVTAQN